MIYALVCAVNWLLQCKVAKELVSAFSCNCSVLCGCWVTFSVSYVLFKFAIEHQHHTHTGWTKTVNCGRRLGDSMIVGGGNDYWSLAETGQRHRRTDGQTNRRHAIARPRFAVCTVVLLVHRAVKTRSSATAEKHRVSCPHGGARPSSPLSSRPLATPMLMVESETRNKRTSSLPSTKRTLRWIGHSRSFKVIHWCRQESRTVCCRNVQLMPGTVRAVSLPQHCYCQRF